MPDALPYPDEEVDALERDAERHPECHSFEERCWLATVRDRERQRDEARRDRDVRTEQNTEAAFDYLALKDKCDELQRQYEALKEEYRVIREISRLPLTDAENTAHPATTAKMQLLREKYEELQRQLAEAALRAFDGRQK